MIYFLSYALICFFLLLAYELSAERKGYSAIVQGKQICRLEGYEDLFVLQIRAGKGANFYNLFADESEFNRLWEGDKIAFSAKKGKLTGRLYRRKFVA